MKEDRRMKFMAAGYFLHTFVFCIGVMFFSGQIVPLGAASENKATQFDRAVLEYNSARFNQAIALLTDIVNDTAAPGALQRNAWWYLTRCYLAKGEMLKAQTAMRELLRYEPPPFEPDPEKESPLFLNVYYQARKERSGSTRIERPDPGVQTLAIIDFKNRSYIKDSQRYTPMEKGFSDILIHSLKGATDLKVVERERIRWILNEHDIQNAYEMEGAVRAGKLLGVHVVLLGSFIIHDKDNVWLSARLVKVETGEVILTAQEKGKVQELFELTEKLSQQIARGIKVEKVYVPRGEVPNSLDALFSYSQGLELLENHHYDQAYRKFMEALEHDPSYERARQKAESIKMLTIFASQ